MEQQQRKKLEKIVEQNEYIKYLGIELLEMEQGYVKARIAHADKILNPYGYIHGGVLYSFADTVAGLAACTYGAAVSTIDGSMNYLRPAIGSKYIVCEAHELRQGKQVAVYRVELFNDENLLLDSGTFTFHIMDEKL